jgi:hypothetical protein
MRLVSVLQGRDWTSWLVDLAVVDVFESSVLDVHGFYFTGDDYRYGSDDDAKQRFIDLIRQRFNAGVASRDRVLKRDTIIEHKANELARFLTKKSLSLDLLQPAANLERQDDRELRARILSLSASQARSLGIGKSTFHCLRKRAESNHSFNVRRSTLARMNRIQ